MQAQGNGLPSTPPFRMLRMGYLLHSGGHNRLWIDPLEVYPLAHDKSLPLASAGAPAVASRKMSLLGIRCLTGEQRPSAHQFGGVDDGILETATPIYWGYLSEVDNRYPICSGIDSDVWEILSRSTQNPPKIGPFCQGAARKSWYSHGAHAFYELRGSCVAGCTEVF